MSTSPSRLAFVLSASLLAACATSEAPSPEHTREVTRLESGPVRQIPAQGNARASRLGPLAAPMQGGVVVRDEESRRYAPARRAAPHQRVEATVEPEVELEDGPEESSGVPTRRRPRRVTQGGVPRPAAPSTPFVETAGARRSTFATDVDTASWDFTRARLLDLGCPPPPTQVRTEELVNALRAEYALPTGGDALRVQLDAAPSPFGAPGHLLLRVGVQARHVDRADRRDASLVLVVDTSGSMESERKLEVVKGALAALVTGALRPTDEVALVAFADQARVVLPPTPAGEARTILEALSALRADGSTNVQAGLELAYANAAAWFRWPADPRADRPHRLCRVVLCTDGIANTGLTDARALLARITDHVQQGVQLTAVGVGITGEGDALLEQLADAGDGQYVYVDGPAAAERAFVEQATGTLQLVAKDAKVQLELDPRAVRRWRLLGYEDRALADRDFRDDRKDAGDVGAGHSVTAFYELEPVAGAPADVPLVTARLRWLDPEAAVPTERAATFCPGDVRPSVEALPPRFLLQAVAAELGELLRGSPHAAPDPWPALRSRATQVAERLAGDPRAAELLAMVERAHELCARSK